MKVPNYKFFGYLIILGALIYILDSTSKIDFLTSQLSEILKPIQIAAFRSKNDFSNFLGVVTNAQNLKREISVLEEENALLKTENARLKKIEEENAILRSQLGIKEFAGKKLEIATTIGFSPVATKKYLVIDKGKENGVREGDLVVVKNILIGKIIRVNLKNATVLLPLDPDSKIPVRTNRGAKGILTGEFQAQMRLKEVLHEETLQEGDLVLTTGEGEVEANLILGQLKQIFKNEKELFQEASVEPLLDLNKLQLVFILKNS